MIREIPCILLLFSDLFPPQPQRIPRNHRTTAAQQTPKILKGMIPLRRTVIPRTRGETPLLLFLSRLPLLGSEQSHKVCSREGEPKSWICGLGQQKRASENQKLSEGLQRKGSPQEVYSKVVY